MSSPYESYYPRASNDTVTASARSLLSQQTLNDLADVSLPESVANDKLLQYNTKSNKWEASNGINPSSATHSIFTTQVVDGQRALLSSKLHFNKTGDTSLMYIYDSENNNTPLKFKAEQDNSNNSNNTVSVTVDNTSNPVMTFKGNKVEVDGTLQIEADSLARLMFYKSGSHDLGEIDGVSDGTNGGTLEFYTKVDGGSVTEKLRINNVGALGIGGANYGNAGQVIVSNGSGNAIEWVNPVNELGDLSDVNTSGLIAEGDVLTLHNAGQNPEYRIKPIPDQIQPALTNLTGGKIVASADLLGEKSLIDSNITTGVNQTTIAGNLTIDSTLTANGSSGTVGQVLTSNGSSPAYWADASGGGNEKVYQLLMLKDNYNLNYSQFDWRRLGDGSNDLNKNVWVETNTSLPNYSQVSSVSDGSLIDATEGAFKAPRDGIYDITASITLYDSTSGYLSYIYAQLIKKATDNTESGITMAKFRQSESDGNLLTVTSHLTAHVTGTVKLLQNELIYVEFVARGSGSYTVQATVNENVGRTLSTYMMVKSID